MGTIAACFDESGKFKDHKVVSIGCVGGYVERFDGDFGHEWESLLNRYGLRVLSGKESLNHRRPLSKKAPCLGVAERTEALARQLHFVHQKAFANNRRNGHRC
jgi:hypothetical protein